MSKDSGCTSSSDVQRLDSSIDESLQQQQQSGYRMGRYMEDNSSQSVAAMQRRHVSDFSNGRSLRGAFSMAPMAIQRPYTDGNAESILQAFDPLGYAQNCKADDIDDNSSDDSNLVDADGLNDKQQHRSPILKVGSDACLSCTEAVVVQSAGLLDSSFHSSSSVGSLVDFSDEKACSSGRQHDSGISSMMIGSSVSVDTLTSDLSDGLKLTELQHEQLDELRTSVSTFDPLMQDDVGSSSFSALVGPTTPPATSASEPAILSRLSSAAISSVPRISVNQLAGVTPAKLRGVHAGNGKRSVRVEGDGEAWQDPARISDPTDQPKSALSRSVTRPNSTGLSTGADGVSNKVTSCRSSFISLYYS